MTLEAARRRLRELSREIMTVHTAEGVCDIARECDALLEYLRNPKRGLREWRETQGDAQG